jgi:hypothetical protein
MGAINKITANQLMRIAGVSAKQYKKVPWHTTTLTVRQLLSAKECCGLIENIYKNCLSPDGDFKIELLDFSLRVNIIATYANVCFPTTPEDTYYIVYASDLYETVCRVVNQNQLNMIKSTVEMRIGVGGVL